MVPVASFGCLLGACGCLWTDLGLPLVPLAVLWGPFGLLGGVLGNLWDPLVVPWAARGVFWILSKKPVLAREREARFFYKQFQDMTQTIAQECFQRDSLAKSPDCFK